MQKRRKSTVFVLVSTYATLAVAACAMSRNSIHCMDVDVYHKNILLLNVLFIMINSPINGLFPLRTRSPSSSSVFSPFSVALLLESLFKI